MRQVVERTNAERAAHGLPPLKLEEHLQQAASWLARDMAAHNTFDHTDSKGRSIDPRLPDFGYRHYHYIGENIAAGQNTPAGVVAGWMQSPGHRANILSPHFREIGVGHAVNRATTYKSYWVQDFGARFGVYPVVINGEAAESHSPNVRLYIYGSGWAEQMRLSNDGTHWTPWEPYRSQRDWTLELGNGPRTVYVELRNGDTILRSADSIELATQAAEAPEGRRPASRHKGSHRAQPHKPRP